MNYLKYPFYLLFLFVIHVSAQTISVNGKIINTANEPQEGALILLSPGNHSTKTDQKGEFHIPDIKKGKYFLSVSDSGFKTLSQKLKVDSNDIHITLTLKSSTIELKEVNIKAEEDNTFGIDRLKSVEGTIIYAGKKNEVIKLDEISANLATNNSRQIYSKIPGLNIWESDGAGLQLGIGGRGLSPNRVSNFNTRQNGYDISADALGYPEAYYIPPSEALDRIEIVRGAASLQYGTQFGGMVNFKLKRGPEDRKFQLQTRQTIGSFGFYNTSNSIGGNIKKWNYYIFHQYKKGEGWRTNSDFNSHTLFSSFSYQANEQLALTFDYTFMYYLAQQAGGLTDKLFKENPRQSIRNRNWFLVNWNLAALTIDYKINEKTSVNSKSFGLIARRDALGFLGSTNRADPMQERNLLSDNFRNFGNETRILHRYFLFGRQTIFAGGFRYYKGITDRKQGNGTAGENADFKYLNPDNLEHSDYDFPSQNIALYTENIFYVFPKFSITPGLRFEHIFTSSEGYYREEYRDLAGNIIYDQKVKDSRSNTRSFVLGGIGISYKASEKIELYGNISQNYRAINFNDMRIVNPSLRVNPDMKDESGYSSDIGMRGNIQQKLNYDISLFLVSYNNRIGSVIKVDSLLFNTYRYRTNISDSRNYGVESFLELDIWKIVHGKNAKNSLSLFVNASWIDARYINSLEPAFENKMVELVAPVLIKTGLTFKKDNFKATYQYSYTAKHYSDATNAIFTSDAVNGIIPAYKVMDLSLEYVYNSFTLATGINNLANSMYFTRRADGYPGPGIIPSDGRNFYLTAGWRF